MNHNKFKQTIIYISMLIGCLGVMFFVLKMWRVELDIPYIYQGDGLSSGFLIKGMIDNGWINVNDYVGAPFGLEMYDYPLGGDNFHYLIMKIISLFSSDYAVVMNIYYFLTYPLAFISSLFVFRQFKVPNSIAFMGSMLFTFLPYHLLRGGHLFLIAYYIIPLVVMVIIWIAQEEELLLKKDNNNKIRLNILNYKSIISLIICIICAASGSYYAFFSCFFLLVIGIFSLFSKKRFLSFITSCILICVIAGGLLVNLSPSIIYKSENGVNQEVAQRNALESETFGMKITQLLLPVTNHRIHWLAEKKDYYNNNAQLVNENDTSSLGVIGALGFIVLLFVFLFYQNRKVSLFHSLGVLNICAVLLGTIGSFGTIFAIFISSSIRSYNRISIFIGFFSIFAVVLLLTVLYNRYSKTQKMKLLFSILVLLVTFFGLFDQTRDSLIPPEVIKSEYLSDRDFIQQIETQVPENSLIFQLPYVTFPEGENLNNMGNYDLFRGYIHSDHLRWSFGGMRNREGDLWYRSLAKMDIKDALEILSVKGFSGIYIDRNGYSTEYMEKLEAELKTVLNVEPIYSSNKRLSFYNMRDFNEKMNKEYSKEQIAQIVKRDARIAQLHKKVLDQSIDWEFVRSFPGYTIVQFNVEENITTNQLRINVINSDNSKLIFDDSFSAGNRYSFRHWESPKHFVLSIPNAESGWENDPTPQEIKKYFEGNNYTLEYLRNQSTPVDVVTFSEQKE